MTYFQTLSAAGFSATAIAYGPGRMGFGLFAPEFRAAFDMSASALGAVSSIGFAGFFAALLLGQLMLTRFGPGIPVVSGLSAAVCGMALVAVAGSVPVLAIGIFLASASAGFAWTPFNDAVNRKVAEVDRPVALSRISTGTSIGIVLSAASILAAVFFDVSWRLCWAAFAATAAIAAVGNWVGLRPVGPAETHIPSDAARRLASRAAWPLYAVAFVLGAISAIYIAFAADTVRQNGPLPGLVPGMGPGALFFVYGLAGFAGLLAGRMRTALGLVTLLRMLMITGAASLGVIVLWPNVWAAVILSAGYQGMAVMVTSAVLSFWSDRLFPALPSLSFTVALLAYAGGSVIGPALAGLAADAYGVAATFLATAVLPLLTAAVLGPRTVSETPVVPPSSGAAPRPA